MKKLPKSLDAKDPAGGILMSQILDEYSPTFKKQGGSFKLSFGIVKWGLSLLKYGKISKKNPEKGVKEAKALGSAYQDEVQRRIINTKTNSDRVQLIFDVCGEIISLAYKQVMYCANGLKAVEAADKWVSKKYGDQFDLDCIKKAVLNNPTTEMGMAIAELTLGLKQADQPINQDHPLIKGLLDTYGHRGDLEVDFGTDKWHEDPSYILSVIDTYSQGDKANEILDHFKEQQEKANQEIDNICIQIEKDYNLKRAIKIRKMYMGFRITSGIRELPKFDMLKCMKLLKEMMYQIGNEFVAEGLMDHKKDINYLFFKHIEHPEQYDLRVEVKEGKARYQKQRSYKTVPRFILSNGECFYQPKTELTGNTLTGVAISQGIIKGKVRILTEPNPSNIQEGEILVTHNTNPSWTPLFLHVGGLIMESGGPLSHGGIVAREYGLPAVAGIAGVTSLLKDGDEIELDGYNGTVKIIQGSLD